MAALDVPKVATATAAKPSTSTFSGRSALKRGVFVVEFGNYRRDSLFLVNPVRKTPILLHIRIRQSFLGPQDGSSVPGTA
eukprot:1075762-Rhodomonas_salina.4